MADFEAVATLRADGNMVQVMDQAAMASERYARGADRARRSTDFLSRSLASMTGNLAAMFTGAVVDRLRQFTRGVVDAGVAAENLQAQLASGAGAENVAGQIDRLRRFTDDLGISFESTAREFAKFQSAAVSTGSTVEEAIEIFEGFTIGARAMGSTSDEIARMITGAQQALAKGVLSMEEWRQQISEAFSPATAALAKAMGRDVDEVMELIASGAVDSRTALLETARVIRDDFGPAAQRMADTSGAAIERFNNALRQLQTAIAQSGILQFLARLAEGWVEVFEAMGLIETRDLRIRVRDLTTEIKEQRAVLETQTVRYDEILERQGRFKEETGELNPLLVAQTVRIRETEQGLGDLTRRLSEAAIAYEQQKREITGTINGQVRLIESSKGAAKAQRDLAAQVRENAREQIAFFNQRYAEFEKEISYIERVKNAYKEYGQTRREADEMAKESQRELIDSLNEWADVLVRLDKEWANVASALLAGLAQVIELSGKAKLNFVDLAGIGLTGAGVGQLAGQAFGGGQTSGIGSLAGGLAGFAIGRAFDFIGPGLGVFLGSAGGGFLESIFGGGRERSPEISIGGMGTTTGRVAGTQGISALGGFGIRNPRGADDFSAFAQVAGLISSTLNQMSQLMTSDQQGAARLALSGFEITMDSDDQRDFNAAIGAFFKTALDAVSEDFGDIFSDLTNNLSLDPQQMADIATGILALDQSLSHLGHTVSAEFIDAMGGVEGAMSGVSAFFANLFTPEELLGMRLSDLESMARNQFGDIMDQFGIAMDGSNFREIFMEVKDSLSPEDLAKWIQLGNTLGLISGTLDDINDLAPATEEAADGTQDLIDGLYEEADAMDATAAAMERELEARLALNEQILTALDIGASFDRALQRNVDTFRIARHEFVTALGTWDLTTDGLRRIREAANDFHNAAMAIFNDLQRIRGIVSGQGQSFLETIQMAGMTPQQRFDFLTGRAQEEAGIAATTDDPGAAATAIQNAINYAQQAWNQLTPEQQAAMGGDFSTWVQGILGLGTTIADEWEAYLRNQGVTLGDLAEDPLQASADIIRSAAEVMRGSADVMRFAADNQLTASTDSLDAARINREAANIAYAAATGAPAVNAA